MDEHLSWLASDTESIWAVKNTTTAEKDYCDFKAHCLTFHLLLFYVFYCYFKYLSKLHFPQILLFFFFHPSSLPASPPSLPLSWVHCCGELHTISASVCCCPGNRDTINRTIFFTPDISGEQSHCFYWHHAFSHPFGWPLVLRLHMHREALADSSSWQPTRPTQLRPPHLCSTAISFSMLFSFPSRAFLGMHLMATSLWVLFSSARTTSEKAPLKDTYMGTWEIMRSGWLFPGTQSPLNRFHEKSHLLLLTKAANM